MILCDRAIIKEMQEKELYIEPFDVVQLQPASYDITLSKTFRVFNRNQIGEIDLKNPLPELTTLVEVDESFTIHPGEFVLGSTIERFEFGAKIVGRLEGKSSLGRLGIIVHATAGYFDPGFCGHATIELSNISGLPVKLYVGMRIGQMAFQYLSGRPNLLYGDPMLHSKYQNQIGPMASKISEDFQR